MTVCNVICGTGICKAGIKHCEHLFILYIAGSHIQTHAGLRSDKRQDWSETTDSHNMMKPVMFNPVTHDGTSLIWCLRLEISHSWAHKAEQTPL